MSILQMIFRGRYRTLILLFLLLVVLLISLNSQFSFVVRSNKPVKASLDHLPQHEFHECVCNVSVTLHGLDENGQNNKQLFVQGKDETVKNIYRKQNAHDLDLISKSRTWPSVHIDISRITLRPNFSRIINSSQVVTTVKGSYALENPELCSSVEDLDIIIIIHSSPEHFQRRLAIRSSWANDAFYKHLATVKVLFLLGQTKDTLIQDTINREFNHFKDMLQGDFKDDYHNLTLKGVMAYKWLTERCRNARFVMKVDDDISVNMFKVFTEVYPKYKNAAMQITCNHIEPNTMPILRQNDSKWFVNENHFRGMDSFPTDYCSGFFILFTNDMIPALYESSKVTPFFWIDDVYLYGLVPSNVPNITYVGLTGPWHQLSGQEALVCYKNLTATCPFLVAGAGAITEMEELWPHMVKRYALSLH